mmetsp:Transcript_11272/g.19987  ORF Transcript_11272/g.19987 Transcript_11272/m.19987 type:complete len:90 (+) Transcript_11272:1287-1556(+)
MGACWKKMSLLGLVLGRETTYFISAKRSDSAALCIYPHSKIRTYCQQCHNKKSKTYDMEIPQLPTYDAFLESWAARNTFKSVWLRSTQG